MEISLEYLENLQCAVLKTCLNRFFKFQISNRINPEHSKQKRSGKKFHQIETKIAEHNERRKRFSFSLRPGDVTRISSIFLNLFTVILMR